MSADDGLKAQSIGKHVGYSDKTEHQVIQRFKNDGLSVIYLTSNARVDAQRAFKDAEQEQLITQASVTLRVKAVCGRCHCWQKSVIEKA